jgi:hypothetical protein
MSQTHIWALFEAIMSPTNESLMDLLGSNQIGVNDLVGPFRKGTHEVSLATLTVLVHCNGFPLTVYGRKGVDTEQLDCIKKLRVFHQYGCDFSAVNHPSLHALCKVSNYRLVCQYLEDIEALL